MLIFVLIYCLIYVWSYFRMFEKKLTGSNLILFIFESVAKSSRRNKRFLNVEFNLYVFAYLPPIQYLDFP